MKQKLLNLSKVAGIAALTTFLAIQAGAQPAPGQGQGQGRVRGNGGNGGLGGGAGNAQAQRVAALGLDDSQLQLYREASQKNADELTKLDRQLRMAQKELVQAALAEKYDETVVRQKAEAVAKIQVDITTLRAKAFSTIAPTLKPEQRDQLENSRAGAAMLTGGGGFGGGGGGGAGGIGAGGGAAGRRGQGGRGAQGAQATP